MDDNKTSRATLLTKPVNDDRSDNVSMYNQLL